MDPKEYNVFEAGFENKVLKVALVGNPNSGKSTLFNGLTGLNQKTGNFPGVTVDKKTGTARLSSEGHKSINVKYIDLPGTYSLYPKSLDEKVAFSVLCDPSNPDYPDMVIVVADASNLKRSLFLASQVVDLKIPVILALNMMDLVERKGIIIDTQKLTEEIGVRVVPVNARKRIGIPELKEAMLGNLPFPQKDFIDIKAFAPELIGKIEELVKVNSNYAAFQIANNFSEINYFELQKEKKQELEELIEHAHFKKNELKARESIERYKEINEVIKDCTYVDEKLKKKSFSYKVDQILTHKFWGYIIFLLILFLIFQTIFYLANYPMDWIEALFVKISELGTVYLPKGELTNLLINGILAGLSGVVVFVPQIALLFAFIAILEDTGYMARVSFIMDKLMRKFGLNGRSVIPLISGVACAVPAIMSTRTINNWKERMITIMVTPLMTCSARLPVYILLISLVVPSTKIWGFLSLQGLALMGLYLIGFFTAIIAAWVMKFILKAKERSYFIMELPVYRIPKLSTIGLTIYEKVKIFLFDVGKIIVAISVVLWVLSSYAPGNRFQQIEKHYNTPSVAQQYTPKELHTKIASEKLKASYAGMIGKGLEPVIKPLGFDWKIGIALVTSFAAREVFVGTMATIYSVGDEDNTHSIRQKMMAATNPETGKKEYSLAVGLSLLIFYAFAMQCMSTMAIVFKETKSWKWPLIQFAYMSVLAYSASFIVFHIFS